MSTNLDLIRQLRRQAERLCWVADQRADSRVTLTTTLRQRQPGLATMDALLQQLDLSDPVDQGLRDAVVIHLLDQHCSLLTLLQKYRAGQFDAVARVVERVALGSKDHLREVYWAVEKDPKLGATVLPLLTAPQLLSLADDCWSQEYTIVPLTVLQAMPIGSTSSSKWLWTQAAVHGDRAALTWMAEQSPSPMPDMVLKAIEVWGVREGGEPVPSAAWACLVRVDPTLIQVRPEQRATLDRQAAHSWDQDPLARPALQHFTLPTWGYPAWSARQCSGQRLEQLHNHLPTPPRLRRRV